MTQQTINFSHRHPRVLTMALFLPVVVIAGLVLVFSARPTHAVTNHTVGGACGVTIQACSTLPQLAPRWKYRRAPI